MGNGSWGAQARVGSPCIQSVGLYLSPWGPTVLVSLPLPLPMQRLPHRKQLSGQNQRDSDTLQSLNKYKDTSHPQAGPGLRPALACECGVSHHRESPRCYPRLQGLWIGAAPGKHWLLFPEDLAWVKSNARPGSSWGRGWPQGTDPMLAATTMPALVPPS